jgi:hypothetical protein
VLARSHELVAYARLGPVPRERIERAYWHPRRPAAFEYWSHAACVLPIEEWPYYAFRRRALRARGKRWHQSHRGTCTEVLARLRAEGPLTATQLGGAKNGSSRWWDDWSDTRSQSVAAGRGRRDLRVPGGLAPGVRPPRPGPPRRPARPRAHRRRVPGPSRGLGGPEPGRGDPGRPDRLSPAQGADRSRYQACRPCRRGGGGGRADAGCGSARRGRPGRPHPGPERHNWAGPIPPPWRRPMGAPGAGTG